MSLGLGSWDDSALQTTSVRARVALVKLVGRDLLGGIGDREDLIVQLGTVVLSNGLLCVGFVFVLNNRDSVGLSELVVPDLADFEGAELVEELKDLTVRDFCWNVGDNDPL